MQLLYTIYLQPFRADTAIAGQVPAPLGLATSQTAHLQHSAMMIRTETADIPQGEAIVTKGLALNPQELETNQLGLETNQLEHPQLL